MDLHAEKLEETVLALLYLNSFEVSATLRGNLKNEEAAALARKPERSSDGPSEAYDSHTYAPS